MNKSKILTIRKINFTGKWVEFWFDEEINIIPADPNSEYEHLRVELDRWIESCKRGELYSLIKTEELDGYISNNGFVGLKTKWVYKSPNWNLIEIFKDEDCPKYELLEEKLILKNGLVMFYEEILSDLQRKTLLEEKIKKMYTDNDVKKFASFLMDEGIVVKSENKNYSMNFLFDVWSGKNPDGLL